MRSTALLSLGAIVGLVVLGYFFSYPSYQRYQNYKHDLVDQTRELDNLKKKQDLIKALEQAEPTLSQKTEAALDLIPVTDQRERFVSEFDSLAQSTGTTLSTFSFSAEKATTKKTTDSEDTPAKKTPVSSKTQPTKALKIGTINFSVTITGPYAAIRDFLYKAQATKRYNTIASLALAGGTNNEASLVITGAIYTKPEPKIPSNLKFNQEVWHYLDNRLTAATPALPSLGRPDPFASY